MIRFLLGLMLCVGFATTSEAQLLKRNRPTATPTVIAPVPKVMPAKVDDGKVGGALTEGHKTLYDIARKRAVGPLARKKNISRDEARKLIDEEIDDATLHSLAAKAGLKFKAMPTGAGGFIQWLIDHQEQILALIKIIMAFFGVDADTATEIAIAIAWDYYNAA